MSIAGSPRRERAARADELLDLLDVASRARPAAGADVGWPAAAGRHRGCAGQRPGGAVRRRADRGARRGQLAAGLRRAARRQREARGDRADRDPRPARVRRRCAGPCRSATAASRPRCCAAPGSTKHGVEQQHAAGVRRARQGRPAAAAAGVPVVAVAARPGPAGAGARPREGAPHGHRGGGGDERGPSSCAARTSRAPTAPGDDRRARAARSRRSRSAPASWWCCGVRRAPARRPC